MTKRVVRRYVRDDGGVMIYMPTSRVPCSAWRAAEGKRGREDGRGGREGKSGRRRGREERQLREKQQERKGRRDGWIDRWRYGDK
jgi:hypothetical protein